MSQATQDLFLACQKDSKGIPRWLAVHNNQWYWLTLDELEERNIAPQPLTKERLQEAANHFGKIDAYLTTLPPNGDGPIFAKTYTPETKEDPTMPDTTTKNRSTFKIRGRGTARSRHANDELNQPWQKSLAPWINLLYILTAIAVFFICLWNIGPYEVAVRFVASKFETSALIDFILWVPVIGWILQGIGNFIFWLIGAVVWGVIQLIELMPLIMTSQPGYVRSVLVQQEAHSRVRVRQDDPGIVRYLKKFYNNLPVRFLVLARRLRGWVYVIDMMIVMMVYPPVREGGIPRFFFLVATGQWSQLDWANIVMMFITLLAVEAVVKVLLIVNHFRVYLRSAKDEQQTVAA